MGPWRRLVLWALIRRVRLARCHPWVRLARCHPWVRLALFQKVLWVRYRPWGL